jgi:hypothetical protein
MKINFTSDNEKQLKDLFLELGFSGATCEGTFGANSVNVMQLMHSTTIENLQAMYQNLEKKIDTLGKVNKWTAPVATTQRVENLKKWYNFIDLLIGYKLFTAQEIATAEKSRKEKAQKLSILTKASEAKEIERINGLSKEELDAEIAALVD